MNAHPNSLGHSRVIQETPKPGASAMVIARYNAVNNRDQIVNSAAAGGFPGSSVANQMSISIGLMGGNHDIPATSATVASDLFLLGRADDDAGQPVRAGRGADVELARGEPSGEGNCCLSLDDLTRRARLPAMPNATDAEVLLAAARSVEAAVTAWAAETGARPEDVLPALRNVAMVRTAMRVADLRRERVA